MAIFARRNTNYRIKTMRKRLSFQYAIEAIVLLLVATCFILLARVAYHDRNLSKSLYADGGDEALALHRELCQLDKVIAGKQAFLQARQHVIDSLKGMIPALPVAQHMGVSRQAVSKWESGATEPSTTNLMELARLYGTTAADLLREVDG